MRPSSPAVREFPLFRTTRETISGEKGDTELSSGHSLKNLRLTIQADGSLVWETGELNCLAKASAISVMGGGFGGIGDRLIGRGFGKFAVDEFDYTLQDCWVTLV